MDSNPRQSDVDDATSNGGVPSSNQFPTNWTPGAPVPANVYYAYPPHPDGIIPVPPPTAYGYYQYPPQPVFFPQQIIPPQPLTEEPLDQDDLNQLEIDQEISRTENSSSPPDEYTEYQEHNEEDLAVMEELEAEMDKITAGPNAATAVAHQPATTSTSGASKSIRSGLPVGAAPMHAGILDALAAEFWFPECRNCECCHGFKHGCQCCKGGVNTCQMENCVNREFASAVASALAARESTQSGPTNSGTSSVRSPSSGQSQPRDAPATGRGGYPYPPQVPYAPQGQPFGGPPPATANGATQPCRFFLQGSCRFGASCRFAHPVGAGPGPAPGSAHPSTGMESLPPPPTRMSMDIAGLCREDSRCRGRGTNCTMRHTPCRFLVSGVYCPYGDSCRYSHYPADVQAATTG